MTADNHFQVIDCAGVAAGFFDYRAAINHLVDIEVGGCSDFCGPALHELHHHGVKVHDHQSHLAYQSVRRFKDTTATPETPRRTTERNIR